MNDPVVSQSESGSRRNLVLQAVVVVALIATLVGVLAIMDSDKKADEASAELSAPSAPPKLGVTVSTTSSSTSSAMTPELRNAIAQAPDVAQAAIESGSLPKDAPTAPPSVQVVPEGSFDPTMSAPESTAKTYKSKLVVSQASEPRAAASSSSSAGSSATSASSRPAPTATPPEPPAGFTIQLGVFSNVSNAESLQRKLKQAGIPAHMETRVQIGPFASKEEAEKVQNKLKRLGMSAGMMVPVAKKHD